MAVDGTYNITMNTPMGARPGTLELKAAGADLSGTFSGQQGSVAFDGGKVDGDNVAWTVTTQSPMGPMALAFSGKVDGDKIAGTVQLGNFGQATFDGTRA